MWYTPPNLCLSACKYCHWPVLSAKWIAQRVAFLQGYLACLTQILSSQRFVFFRTYSWPLLHSLHRCLSATFTQPPPSFYWFLGGFWQYSWLSPIRIFLVFLHRFSARWFISEMQVADAGHMFCMFSASTVVPIIFLLPQTLNPETLEARTAEFWSEHGLSGSYPVTF